MRRGARAGITAAIVLLVLLTAVVMGSWQGLQGGNAAEGDPRVTRSMGSAAVAQVLTDHQKIRMTQAMSADQIGDARGATLLVFRRGSLAPEALASVKRASTTAQDLVVVQPHQSVLKELVPEVESSGGVDGALTATCVTDLTTGKEEIGGPSETYRFVGATKGQVCFPGPAAITESGGAVVTFTRPSGQRVTVIGNPWIFSNSQLTELDHAAMAVRYLSRSPHLIWYLGIQDPRSTPKDAASSENAWPPAWFQPLVLALAGMVVALMWWRGRRLGRLAQEPLPVIVQANETTVARSQMYRRARQPAYAASVLQEATRHRLSPLLGLPEGSDTQSVAAAVSARTGRPTDQVLAALTSAPDSSEALTTLAGDLTTIEKEVRRS
ncbi:putative membrane protein [Austwickia sp. TVS 96-490-7B]|uniref:DUF4350 domain-containing protein n=1 Tax=Austwickia sp. TVS 96-490-7B TaxID=2830843 RepID=UPI001C584E11|nr:DUF4350 domain-containing protein [Austwickia sp. TVS 96-490-7B]MBW3084666.1 putative membrane protein [Austwickia sp. TVS 96-490-7B]